MPKSGTVRIPKLSLHKASGQGYLRLNGRCHYLGKFRQPSTHEKAARMLAEWIANGMRLPVAPTEITLAEVFAAYWEHCLAYYRRPDGSASERTLGGIHSAMEVPVSLYGTLPALEYGPLALRTCREIWIDRGLRRSTVNMHVGNIKRAFRWAASLEMLPVSAYEALRTLEGLRAGRSRAKEPRRILPVLERHVSAVQPHLSRQVWGLVRLQRLTGARSGEILKLRRCDVDTTGEVWIVRLDQHKTAYCARERTLYLGEKAQGVLREFFPGKSPFEYLFDPRDAERERYAQCETHRHQAVPKSRTKRTVGNHYTADSYRRAVTRACEAAGIAPWHPHQLRHTCATEVRKKFGLDAAAVFLGHAKANGILKRSKTRSYRATGQHN